MSQMAQFCYSDLLIRKENIKTAYESLLLSADMALKMNPASSDLNYDLRDILKSKSPLEAFTIVGLSLFEDYEGNYIANGIHDVRPNYLMYKLNLFYPHVEPGSRIMLRYSENEFTKLILKEVWQHIDYSLPTVNAYELLTTNVRIPEERLEAIFMYLRHVYDTRNSANYDPFFWGKVFEATNLVEVFSKFGASLYKDSGGYYVLSELHPDDTVGCQQLFDWVSPCMENGAYIEYRTQVGGICTLSFNRGRMNILNRTL